MRILLLLLSFLLPFYDAAQEWSLPFRHYSAASGLCSNTVYFGMQDSRGYLWFCTDAGINRFDGKDFETFTVRDGLADNENFRCIESRDGRVWFSSYIGRLCYYDGYTFKNPASDPDLRLSDSLHLHITGMNEDSEGRIWFSRLSNKGVWSYNKGVKGQFVYGDSLWKGIDVGARSFFSLRDTMHYFNADSIQLFHVNCLSGVTTAVKCPEPLQKNMLIRPTTKPFRGNICFNDYRYIFTLSHDSLQILFDINDLPLAPDTYLQCFEYLNGRLWLGTSRGLLLVPHPEQKKNQHYDCFFAEQAISSLSSDREGGLWATTMTEGVYYLPGTSAFTTLIPMKSLTAIGHSRKDDVYAVGSYYGQFRIFSGTQIVKSIDLTHPFPDRIREFYWASSDDLLVGMDGNLKRFDLKKNKFSIFPTGSDLWKHFGGKDLEPSPAGLWLAGLNRIVLVRDWNTNDPHIDSVNFWSEERMRVVAGDRTAGCWFCSVTHLLRFDLATRHIDTLAGTALFRANLNHLKKAEGMLWVATDGNGIFIFENDRFVRHMHTGNSELSSNVCRKLFFDNDHRMWVATNKGIDGFIPRTGHRFISLAANDVRDLDIYDGKLYAATSHGVMIVDLTHYHVNTNSPKVTIKSFTVGGKARPFFQPPVFSYFNGPVKVKYTAITFESNELLRYRYRLETDSIWNETNSNELEFYNLPPGDYNILLSAKKYNSAWSPVSQFRFTIVPLWYQTLWFHLLVISGALGLLAFTSWLFIRSARRKSDLQRRTLESELKAIRLYMNPHFIFNSLSSLQAFVLSNKWQEAGNYISHFAKLIRRTMVYSERNAVSLEEEIGFLKNYIELEQTRFEGGFDFRLSIPESAELSVLSIPPLVIQPIVENAIKYGLNRTDRRGILELSFTPNDDLLLVVVQDNGPGRRQVMAEQATFPNRTPSTGIKYTEERLRLLLRKHKVAKPVIFEDLVKNGEPAGTKVTLIIPLLHE